MNKKAVRTIPYVILAILLLTAACKLVLCGLAPDEEYQITMSYRLVQGDGMFYKAWDTIQTSSFLNVLLIRLYLLGGTTEGIVIFLRICGILIQTATAAVLFLLGRKEFGTESAVLISAVSFLSVTKTFISPDFSTIMLWSQVLMLCSLWYAFKKKAETGKVPYVFVVLAATCLCGSVLSQACFLLVPVIAVMLCVVFREDKGKISAVFWGTCVIVGCIWLVCLFAKHGIGPVLNGVRGVLQGDNTHASGANIMGRSIILTYAQNVFAILALLTATVATATGITFLIRVFRSRVLRKESTPVLFLICLLSIIGSVAVTLWVWLIQGNGYEGMRLYIPMALVIELVLYIRMPRERKSEGLTKLFFFGTMLGLAIFINVLFISNVPLTSNLSFLLFAVLCGGLLNVYGYRDVQKNKEGKSLLWVLLTVMSVGAIVMMQGSPAGYYVWNCDGRIDYGPAKGVLTSKHVAQVYSAEGRSFAEMTGEGDTVLLVTNCYLNTALYYCYLENNVDISHYSVNSTPSYTKTLENYWVTFPEKYPDVIVVNNDTMYTDMYDWILYYIEGYYGYTRMEKTEYATYYYR